MPMLIGPDSPSPQASGTGGFSQAQLGQQQNASALMGVVGNQLGVSQAGYQQNVDQLQNQIALGQQNVGLQSGYVNQDLQNQLAQFGLQRTGIGQQQAFQQGQFGRQQQGFGLQQQQLDYLKNLYPQQNALQQQNFGIQEKSLADQLQQAQYQYGQNVHGAWSDATARGATNTAGFGGQQGTLSNLLEQLGYQERGIGRQQQSLGVSEQQAKLGFDQQMFGLGQQQKQLGLSEQGAAASNQYQQQQIQSALTGLGMNETQARQSANRAITSLGLQNQISTDQLLSQIGQASQGQVSNLMGILPQIMSVMQGFGG